MFIQFRLFISSVDHFQATTSCERQQFMVHQEEMASVATFNYSPFETAMGFQIHFICMSPPYNFGK